ncbi:MAG: GIY-YIG nuclease family protein [Candidatus Marinimicrobia bacterium]|nr:GIY-YIG nuclease family protein [Candidatus Neomarinimicrobiota bacterium]MCF7880468.1 GIY-YIG nuclease family protein [Candidatus Neomarinimicrobiota bacterium]
MYYSLFILYCEKADRFYIGVSDDVEHRLTEHNSGKSVHGPVRG